MAIVGPKINTAFTLYLPLVTVNADDWKATPTIAAGDIQVSVDGGATFANPATLPSETAASSKVVKVVLAAGEMNAAAVIVRAIDQTATKEWKDTGEIIYTTTYGVGASVLQTGDSFARLGAPAGVSTAADIAAVKVDTAAILVDTGTTLDGKLDDLGGRIPAALVDSRMDSYTGAMGANVMTAAAAAADLTTELQSGLATAANLALVPTANQNADALLDRAAAIETGVTPRQAIKYIAAAAGGVSSGMTTTGGTATFDAIGNTGTARIVAPLDASGNRTSVTLS